MYSQTNESEVTNMKQEMMKIVQEMVDNGYYLFNETVEQFVDRMISYGFDLEFEKRCRDKFLASKRKT